jgi:hypothetical protein
MTPENLGEIKHRYAQFWSEIKTKLPEKLSPEEKNFARGYFRAQLRLRLGRKVRAGKIFRSLDKNEHYLKFEDNNHSLLAAIDLAVRGETRWSDVEPLFRMNNKRENIQK